MYFVLAWAYSSEPRHDKTNKTNLRPAKTQISLGIRPVWSVFAVRIKKVGVLSYPLSAQRRLWSDWADAQADLSLRWAHTHFVGFVMSWLIYSTAYITANLLFPSSFQFVERKYREEFAHGKVFLSLSSSLLTRSTDGSLYEPPHDKTNKMTLRPAKTQISLGVRPV